MSWAAVRLMLQLGREPGRFTDAEFRLLVNLADRLNEQTGQLNPSITTMAEDMGRQLDPDATLRPRDQAGAVLVRQLLRRLEHSKELERADTTHKGGQVRGRRYPSQSYRLTLQGAYDHPTGGASRSPSGGASDSSQGEPQAPTGGASGSPNLGSEPVKRTSAAKPAPSRSRSGLAAQGPNPADNGRVQVNDRRWRDLPEKSTGMPESIKVMLDDAKRDAGLVEGTVHRLPGLEAPPASEASSA
jgi:hypothetical protein